MASGQEFRDQLRKARAAAARARRQRKPRVVRVTAGSLRKGEASRG